MSNRYEIKEKIGQGGVGAVYKAFDTQLKRDVALKRLVSGEEAAEGGNEDVLKEATTLSALQHPNIVTVYDVGQDEKGPFVVMELLKGETFDDTITRGALTEADFRTFVAQSLEAVIAAHDREMIHRDLKPGNLMVIWLPSGKFQIKILDFGLAKFGKQPSKQTTDHEDGILGSIFFMAPEQFERIELDARTDLYSLGCIYYYALTTKYPFNGDTPAQVMAAHLRHQVRDIAPMRPDIPKWMCDWVMWLVSREMKDRPESAVRALEYFNREEIPLVEKVVETPTGKKLVTGPVSTGAATPKSATSPQAMQGALPGQPAMAIPAQTGPIPEGSGTTQPIAFAGPPAKAKGRGFPVWAWVSIPVLLAVLLGVVYFKKEGQKEQRELNMKILKLTEDEEPVGDAKTVEQLLDFVRAGTRAGASKLEANNASAVLSTLGRLEGDGVDEAIVDALKSTKGKARAGVIGVLNQREQSDAINLVAAFLADAYTKEEREAAITFIQWRGGPLELTNLLTALKSTDNDSTRQTFERAIVSLARQIEDPRMRPLRVINSLPEAKGEYRHSLLKILSQIGGKDAWETMKRSIDSSDGKERSVAINSMVNWPDYHPLQDMYDLAKRSKAVNDREGAARAVIAMINRPNPLSADQQIDMIDGIYGVAEARSTKRELIVAASRILDQKSVDFLKKEAQEGGQIGEMAKAMAARIEKALAGIMDVDGAATLQAKDATVEGEGGIRFNKNANAVTNWDMEGTRVRFPVRFKSAGKYSLSAVQAVRQQGGSSYTVTVGDQVIDAKTKKTGGPDNYETVKLGEITIENPGNFMIDIIPLDITDYELMNFRALKLERTGEA